MQMDSLTYNKINLQLVNEMNETLRQKSIEWDFQEDPSELVKEMTRIMFENNGIGLSAPQIGVNKRLFIMGNKDNLVACINPEIVSGEGTVRDVEGCLSFPDLWLHVNRYEKIQVKYFNLKGEVVEKSLDGFMARVFQHEYDHLDGVCFDTKTSKLGLKLARERQAKTKKLKASAVPK